MTRSMSLRVYQVVVATIAVVPSSDHMPWVPGQSHSATCRFHCRCFALAFDSHDQLHYGARVHRPFD